MTTESKKRGRPAEFRNAAEKQKAYRERLKAQNQEADIVFEVMKLIESKAQTLRNSSKRHAERNKVLEIAHSDSWTQTYVDRHVQTSVESVVFQYMLLRGELEFVRKDWTYQYYTIKQSEVQ